MDILSYIVEGCGRHADSLGNREVYASPGFQWMSVGSGVEHAEGGGTPAGERTHGFQIWLKMPRAKMGDAPRYGTVEPSAITTVDLDGNGSVARVIAGPFRDATGPASFAVTVQIVDVDLRPGFSSTLAPGTCRTSVTESGCGYARAASTTSGASSPLPRKRFGQHWNDASSNSDSRISSSRRRSASSSVSAAPASPGAAAARRSWSDRRWSTRRFATEISRLAMTT